jgi:hypothetical protein
MSTRGIVGVRVDGQDKLAYNHSDSYPEGLGDDVVKALRVMLAKKGLAKIKELARAVRLVDEQKDKPTPSDIARFREFCNTGVGGQTETDWYCLLRDLQGDIEATLNAGVMLDAREFIKDSLFCEWAYVINLDDEVLEVYMGFQRKPPVGRYAAERAKKEGGEYEEYYPCTLVASFPFAKLPRKVSASKEVKAAIKRHEDE